MNDVTTNSVASAFFHDVDDHKVRLLRRAYTVIMAFAVPYSFILYFTGSILYAICAWVYCTILFFCNWALRWPKWSMFSANVCLLISLVYLTNITLGSGNLGSPQLVWEMLIPIAALFMISRQGLFIWLGMTIGSFLLLLYLHIVGWSHPVPMNIPLEYYPYIRLNSYTDVMLITGAFFYFYSKAVSDSYEEVVKSKEQISNLVRMLGHDIAGPIMVIDHFADRLDVNKIDSLNLNKISEVLKKNSEAIRILTGKIAELNALESGKRELTLVPMDLARTVEKAVGLMRERYDKKNVGLEYLLKGDSFQIIGEPDILSLQVIPNLLSNALKFSPEGSKVSVEIVSNNNQCCILIQDQGIGIPAPILASLFSYHKKTTRVGTDGEKGTGFGMPLVKSFIEKMKGSIEVSSVSVEDSPEKHGTSVKVTFNTDSN